MPTFSAARLVAEAMTAELGTPALANNCISRSNARAGVGMTLAMSEDRHHRRHRDPGPAAGQGRKDRDKFISGKDKQNAVKSMVVTDGEGRVLWCSPIKPGSCADITHARQLGLVELLAGGPAVEILADAGYQGLVRAGIPVGGSGSKGTFRLTA